MRSSSTPSESYLTWLILGMSTVPFILLQQNGLKAIDLWFMPTTLTALLSPASFFRLWTPTFIHYTLLHLITNIYLWWLLAQKLERQSRLQLFIVFAISAAVSNLCQWIMTGSNFGGLSGVVYALLSYLWLLNRYAGQTSYHIDPPLGLLLLLLLPLSATGLLGKYSDYAHIGGLITGAFLAACYKTFCHKQTTKTDTID